MSSHALPLSAPTIIIPESTHYDRVSGVVIEDEISQVIERLALQREDEANGVPGAKEAVNQSVELYATLCAQRRKLAR